MHEMSIVQSVVAAVRKERDARGLGRVLTVRLRIGRMSGVMPDALSSCWDLATQDGDLSASRLATTMTEPCLRCLACRGEFAFNMSLERCPTCGAGKLGVDGGTDLSIESLEVE